MPKRRFRVTVIEWLRHDAIIDAADAEEAEELVIDLWNANSEAEIFRFRDSGLDGVVVDGL
jgi:hypothetical protein